MSESPKSPPLRIAAFAGSLRRGSYNRSLLAACLELSPADVAIEILSVTDLPFFNAELEGSALPSAVAAFRAAIAEADGLLIASPEYNYGVTAVTKNAVDWCSRPHRGSALDRRPVAILGASPGMSGTARGQGQLRQNLAAAGSLCMPQPELLVGRAAEKFDVEGRLTDAPTREHLGKFLIAFAAWVRRFQPLAP